MTEPVEVAASEADLIAMARALVGSRHDDAALWVWRRPRVMPDEIGPTCGELLADALRQLWVALWRRDGARPGATVRGTRGRGWERHAPAALDHTAATLQVLRWLVTSSTHAPLAAMPLGVGDQVVIYLALDLLAATPAQAQLATEPLVAAAPLAWLGFAPLFQGRPPSFASLVDGPGAIVVEALTGELGRRWQAVELSKRSITDPAALVALGAAQDATLGEFMAACDARRRRDLAGFVLDAAAPLLERGLAPIPMQLDPDAPLSARMAARNAAAALLRGVVRWRDWDDQHRGVRFIDDDYGAAQLLLTRYERVGRAGAELASAWISELAALPTAGPTSGTIGDG